MDDLGKLVAAVDQAGEKIKLLAPVVHGYFEALQKEGFTRAEALYLVKELQSKVFSGNNN